MHPVVVELNDNTYKALKRVTPSPKRSREFVRQAVKDAVLRQEFAKMREAYLKQPDSDADGDDWSNCDPFVL